MQQQRALLLGIIAGACLAAAFGWLIWRASPQVIAAQLAERSARELDKVANVPALRPLVCTPSDGAPRSDEIDRQVLLPLLELRQQWIFATSRSGAQWLAGRTNVFQRAKHVLGAGLPGEEALHRQNRALLLRELDPRIHSLQALAVCGMSHSRR